MKHVIITNLSTLRSDAGKAVYTSDKGSFEGTNTNDAPVKYLLTCLKEHNPEEKIRIIAITTPQAEDAYEAIKKTIKEFTNENQMQIEENEIKKVENVEFQSTIREIISLVNSDDGIYLDTTGGMRNAVYFLMTLVRILEYSGISLKKAIYSNYTKHEIEDVTPDYQRLNLINSEELFTSLGNSDGLQKFFEGKKSTEIKNVIKAMNRFSEEIALCRTSGLDEILEQLNTSLNELDNMTPTTENEILFQSISGVIRKKFGIQEGSHKKIDYVDMIRWCLDNKQIQQAVTIYTEKMPSYLFQKGYYSASKEKIKEFKKAYPAEDTSFKLFLEGFMKLELPKTFSSSIFLDFLESAKKNEKIESTLLNASNIEELKKEITILDNEQLEVGLQRFFILKNAMYDEANQRYSQKEITRNLEKYPVLQELPFKITAKKKETFLKELTTKKTCVEILQNCSFLKVKGKKCRTIEYLEYVLKAQDDYQIYVSVQKMQEIMRDFLYIRWFRNTFNHASDKNKMIPEEKQYLISHGYYVDSEKIEDITTLLRNALEHLQK